jgi:hypothetical protein
MQSISKIMGGQSERSDHALYDVAVVAKQSAWLLAVMAMIGAWLLVAEWSAANPASVALLNQQGGEGVSVDSGPVLPNGVEFLLALVGVGLDSLPEGLLVGGVALFGAPLGSDIGPHVVLASALFGLVGSVVLLLTLNGPLAVLRIVAAAIGFVRFPLLRAAIRLFHVAFTPLETSRFLAQRA